MFGAKRPNEAMSAKNQLNWSNMQPFRTDFPAHPPSGTMTYFDCVTLMIALGQMQA